LAGETTTDDIDPSAPGQSVEGAYIIPDGKGRQVAFSLSINKALLTIGIDLDGADRHMAKQHPSEDTSPGSGKQMEFAQGT
jgi:hypothetical protein